MKVPTRSSEECQHAMRALPPTEGRFLLNPDLFGDEWLRLDWEGLDNSLLSPVTPVKKMMVIHLLLYVMFKEDIW